MPDAMALQSTKAAASIAAAAAAAVAERALEGSHSSLRPSSARALDGRRSLERRSSRNGERERHRELEASPPKPLPPPPPEVDWDLGLPAELDGDWAEVRKWMSNACMTHDIFCYAIYHQSIGIRCT